MTRNSMFGGQGGWDPFRMLVEIQRFQMSCGLAAAEVIAKRSQMALTGTLTSKEANRMLAEKQSAAAKAVEAGATALMTGASPHVAARRAGKKLSTPARANARRLRG